VSIFKYAAPSTFYPLAGKLTPWFAVIAIVLGITGLYLGLIKAPVDFQQGQVYRVIFIHVPTAWMAMFIYLVMAAYAVMALT
jgi:heme exporter protein C